MNIKKTSLTDPESVLKEMIESGEIDYGKISDGLCATPESQIEFDQNQKDQPPLID